MNIRTRLVVALALCSTGPTQACEGLKVEHAWLREPPPGADVAAAYFDALNQGRTPVRLVAVSSTEFGGAMLHAMETVDGRMRMRPQGEVVIAPGERYRAAPGGNHVMLWNAHAPVSAAGKYSLTLRCDDGVPLTVPLPVLRDAPTTP